MNTSDSAAYGEITFEDHAANQTPAQLRETDFFKYILQKCKHYRGIVFDHESLRVDGWDYGGDNWNGTELPNHAPTCHLVKPFKYGVSNLSNAVRVSLTLNNSVGHLSAEKDLIIPHTLLIENSAVAVDDLETIRGIAQQQGWSHTLDKETLGILQMLSHLIDQNVLNGTRDVWVDDIDITCGNVTTTGECPPVPFIKLTPEIYPSGDSSMCLLRWMVEFYNQPAFVTQDSWLEQWDMKIGTETLFPPSYPAVTVLIYPGPATTMGYGLPWMVMSGPSINFSSSPITVAYHTLAYFTCRNDPSVTYVQHVPSPQGQYPEVSCSYGNIIITPTPTETPTETPLPTCPPPPTPTPTPTDPTPTITLPTCPSLITTETPTETETNTPTPTPTEPTEPTLPTCPSLITETPTETQTNTPTPSPANPPLPTSPTSTPPPTETPLPTSPTSVTHIPTPTHHPTPTPTPSNNYPQTSS